MHWYEQLDTELGMGSLWKAQPGMVGQTIITNWSPPRGVVSSFSSVLVTHQGCLSHLELVRSQMAGPHLTQHVGAVKVGGGGLRTCISDKVRPCYWRRPHLEN